MKRVLSGFLAGIVLMGALCIPSFAAQTYEIKDTFSPTQGLTALRDFIHITADSVVKAEAVDVGNLVISSNFPDPVPAYSAVGKTTVFFGDTSNIAPYICYAPTWKNLRASDYTWVKSEALSNTSEQFTLDKAGLYVVEVPFWSIPVKTIFVIEVVDKASDRTVTPVDESAKVTVKSFSDVPAGRWSHGAVLKMAEEGVFAGTTAPDANGVATFNPEGTMTQAEFVTVVTKLLYGPTLETMRPGKEWYTNFYTIASQNGLLVGNYFPIDDANKPITRERMALLAVRAATKRGEQAGELVDESRIADLNQATVTLRAVVRRAFSMGLVSGYDDKGTFGPQDTLTREQGAMIMYKLMYPDQRQQPTP